MRLFKDAAHQTGQTEHIMSNKKTSERVVQGASKPTDNSAIFDLLDAAAEALQSGDYWKAKADLSGAMRIVDQQILDMEHAGQK